MWSKRPPNNDRDLILVIQWASGLGLGLMAAFLYSVKEVTPEFRYQVSIGTWVSFAAAAAFSWAFWRLVFGKSNSSKSDLPKSRKRALIILSTFLMAATLGAFAYALKGVTNEKVMEIVEGTGLAVLALGGVGFLLWKAARFLESDSKRADDNSDSGPEQP